MRCTVQPVMASNVLYIRLLLLNLFAQVLYGFAPHSSETTACNKLGVILEEQLGS